LQLSRNIFQQLRYLSASNSIQSTFSGSRSIKQLLLHSMAEQRQSEQLQFVNRLNPVTGEMEWTLLPVDYDYRQEIACSAYGDMLHDTARNKAYYNALRRAIERMPRPVRVLDIGTGSGLLSMMACRLGADTVTACEAFQPVAECASRVLAANGFLLNNASDSSKPPGRGVRLISKRSTDVNPDTDLADGALANLLVAELFDTELIGEGALQSYQDAAKRLLTPNAVVLPWEGRLRCVLFQSDTLARYHYLQSSPWRRAPGADACPGLSAPLELQLSQLMPGQDFQLLSEPFEVRRFPFGPPDCLANLPESGDDVISVSVPWLESGLETADDAELTVTGCFLWWDLLMDPWPEAELLSTEPAWVAAGGVAQFREHWMQSVHFFPTVRRLYRDQRDSLKLLHWHDGYSNYFDLLPDSAASPAPPAARFCSCGIHQTVNRARLAETQDPSYSSGHVDWIKSVLELCPTDRALATVGDLCILPHLLASAAIDRQPLLCVEPRRRCREAVIESNQLLLSSGRIVAELPKLAELMDGGYGGLILLAEPSFASSLLPWDDLRFWHLAAAGCPATPAPPISIYPNVCRIMAAPMLFDNLHKLRAPVGPDGCEGFDLSEFDRLAEPAAEATWSRLESQPLWEYPGQLLAQPKLLLELRWSEHFLGRHTTDNKESSSSSIQSELCEFFFNNSAANGVALWCDWFAEVVQQVDANEIKRLYPVLYSGLLPVKNPAPDRLGPNHWNRFRRQGVLMLTPGRGSSPIAKDRRRLALTAKYELDSAELAVSVAP
ncbi:hypothetical protein BOX15_Mlig031608g3, partial [Macrostomum lignano]